MDRTREGQLGRVGDVIVVNPHHLGEPERTGEILDVLGESGHEHFRVRWDDGHESIFYPGNDATVRRESGKEGLVTTDRLRLRSELDRLGVEYELIPHERTLNATAEAKVVGVAPKDVGKTIVLRTERGYIRAALAASDRLDLHKVREALPAGHDVRLATEAELAAAYPMFELGAVPPWGGPSGDRVVVDRRLADRESIVVEAGAHDESLRLKTADLLAVTGADVVDLAE
jgi:Ala-tRNA(Pro) deacylase